MNASCVLNLGFASTEKELEDLIFGYFWQSVPFWKSTLHVSSSSSYPQVLLQMLDHRKVLGVQLWFVRCYRYSRVICLNKVLEHSFCRFLCAFIKLNNSLRRYDTIKTLGKYVKSGLKTGRHHAIFWFLEVKRSKILHKLNKRDCFCLHSWLHFLWRFLRKNWFT